MKTVFISSTFIDLKDYRSEIINSIRRLNLYDISMENFGARDERPLTECQKLIGQSDIFVGIYAHRYGYIPTNQSRSITELEYDHAINNQKPCFLYVVDENHPWPPNWIDNPRNNIDNFKNSISAERIVGKFTNKDHLAASVSTDLGRFLLEMNFPNLNSNHTKVVKSNPESVDEWINYRNQIYSDSGRFFLVHTLWPSKDPDQEYDIFIYLIPHKNSNMNDVLKAEFFFGRYWDNEVYTVENIDNQIGISTSAYGPFLAVCKIYLKDGSTKILSRYIDFEQGELFYKQQ